MPCDRRNWAVCSRNCNFLAAVDRIPNSNRVRVVRLLGRGTRSEPLAIWAPRHGCNARCLARQYPFDLLRSQINQGNWLETARARTSFDRAQRYLGARPRCHQKGRSIRQRRHCIYELHFLQIKVERDELPIDISIQRRETTISRNDDRLSQILHSRRTTHLIDNLALSHVINPQSPNGVETFVVWQRDQLVIRTEPHGGLVAHCRSRECARHTPTAGFQHSYFPPPIKGGCEKCSARIPRERGNVAAGWPLRSERNTLQ